MLYRITPSDHVAIFKAVPPHYHNISDVSSRINSMFYNNLDCCCVTIFILLLFPSFDKRLLDPVLYGAMLLEDSNNVMFLEWDVCMPLDETPDRLLEAGARLFAKHGYKGVSLNKLAHEAKTSSSSILHFFESKEGLLKAICDRIWREINDRIAKSYESTDSASAKCEKILLTVLGYFDNHQDEERLIILESRQIDERQEGPITREHARFKETFDAILQEGKKENSFQRVFSVPAAREGLFGLVEGMLWARLLDKRFGYSDAKYSKKEIENIVKLTIRGISVTKQKTRRKR